MKKVFLTITVVILFIGSLIIFWLALSPKTFYAFWQKYPVFVGLVSSVDVTNDPSVKNLSVGTSTDSAQEVMGKRGQVTIGNTTWDVEVAATEKERESGLSNRRVFRGKNGMLFVFDSLDQHTFWMKDMLFSIDMIFFDDVWRVVKVEKDLEPNSYPNTFGRDIKSKYILEINAGEAESFGISVGDQAFFSNK